MCVDFKCNGLLYTEIQSVGMSFYRRLLSGKDAAFFVAGAQGIGFEPGAGRCKFNELHY